MHFVILDFCEVSFAVTKTVIISRFKMEDSPNDQPDDLMNVVENGESEKPRELNEDEIDNETDDNSQEEETHQFLSLMSKAEKKNQRRIARKEKLNLNKTTWRNVNLGDPDEESTDTEDEDDPTETRKFLNMMKQGSNKTKKLVNIRWVSGKVSITPVGEGEGGDLTITRLPPGQTQTGSGARPRKALPDTVTVTRVPAQGDHVRSQQAELERRRREVRAIRAEQQQQAGQSQQKGKRKFEERMTLTEAKIGDFQDSRDYVDFLQSKLQGINIKIVK